LRTALGGAAGLALGPGVFSFPTAQAQAVAVRTTSLGETLHVLTVESINVVAKTGPGGTVLVDGGPAAARAAMLEAVAGLSSSGPVRTLFNTHWHPEQTGLNEHVGTAGGAIIAQENTRLWLTTDITYPWDGEHFEPLPKIAQPNLPFYDEGDLDSGIRYGYLRHAAHTDGDLYVQFPDENVLAVGDTVSGASWPFVDWWTGGWIGGIVGNLELLLSLANAETRIVPARGPVLRRTDLETQYAMYNVIYERLARMLNAGRGPDEAVAERPTAEFDATMGPSDEFVRRAFESLWAYLSPDA
jgi:glyoxylase-like metal-dependent hydrolase (beta-lactamase superfamily II)